MKIKHSVPYALLTILTCVTSASAQNLISNGSFEERDRSGFNSNIRAGLPGWTIGNGGGIDIVFSRGIKPFYWQAAEGNVSLSLNWGSPGSISQVVATEAGTRYLLSFSMAAEIYGGQASRTMDVVWSDVVVGTPTFSYTGQGSANMGWVQFTYEVVGSGRDTLAFRSTTPANYGPALDAVALVPAAALKPASPDARSVPASPTTAPCFGSHATAGSTSVPALNLLRIAGSDEGVVLTWPATATNCSLTACAGFPGAPWVLVTNSPVQIGPDFQIILEPATEARFFRLERPFAQ
jgi:hypothetical protein